MPCFDQRWLSVFSDGSRRYGEVEGAVEYVPIPCGVCLGCDQRAALDWMTRLHAQSLVSDCSVCVTPTYADEHLPPGGSLRRADLDDFIRRFRRLSGLKGIKFHAIGEYSPVQRPHYHLCLFGVGDSLGRWEPAGKSKGGGPQFSCSLIDEAWRERGRVTFQPFSGEAARYVASHEASKRVRRSFFSLDGKGRRLEDEFMTCSKGAGGGIGRAYVERFGAQLLAQDSVVFQGGDTRPVPRAFDKILAAAAPEAVAAVKLKRQAARLAREALQPQEGSLDRLAARHEVLRLKRERKRSERKL